MASRPHLACFVMGLLATLGLSALAQSSDSAVKVNDSKPTHPAAFSLVTDHQPVVSLDGLWRFHPGDDPDWAAPNFDDSAWTLLRSDKPWTTQGYGNLSGFAWYRFTVQAPSPAMPLALLLPSILTDYEVFENGKKVGGAGRMPPHGSLRFNQTLLYHLDTPPAGTAIELAIRVWHHPTFAAYLGGGPRYGGAMLGEDSLIDRQFHLLQAERLTRVVSFFAVGILNAVISITVFGLYLFRRSEREYLWFAILLLTSALQLALVVSDFILNFRLGIRDVLAETLGAAGMAASLFFFSRVLGAKRSWAWYAVLIVALLDPMNVGLYLLRYTSPATSTSLRVVFDLPIEIFILVLLLRRAIAGSSNARLLLLPTFLLYGTGILGGVLLFSFQLGWQPRTLTLINQWNVIQTPFPMPLQNLVQLIFIVALLAFLIRRFTQSRAKEERYAADLEAARMLQQVLIPEAPPHIPHLEISAAYHPASEVGGDFYQIVPLPATAPNSQSEVLIVLGDVAGKGVAAAMTVSLLVGALRSLVEITNSPAEILAGLNRRLVGRGSGFTTCLSIRLSPSGAMTLANAGHLAPYRNGLELPCPPALPLGFDPDATFPEEMFNLNYGDRLTLLTDGVPEASCGEELFGFERTARLSNSTASIIAETALNFGQTDDITVLSIVAHAEQRMG
jgi:sigma-B regulation protein RsbU (phosphoserine phosphatase)